MDTYLNEGNGDAGETLNVGFEQQKSQGGRPAELKADECQRSAKCEFGKKNSEEIPLSMRNLCQWVAWKSVPNADGSVRKLPVNPSGGKAVSCSDRSQWATFEQACAYAINTGHGIGFVFSKDDRCCGIDLDDCLDAHGQLKPWAQSIIDRAGNTYIERSPSGTGVKIYGIGVLPGGGKQVSQPDGGQVELYDQGRFFAVTGEKLLTAPSTLGNLDQLIKQLYPSTPRSARTQPVASNTNTKKRVPQYAVQACRQRLARLPRSVSGRRGHNALFRAACEISRFGVTGGRARELLQFYNQQCSYPGWSEKQMRHKLHDAEKRVRKDRQFGLRLRKPDRNQHQSPNWSAQSPDVEDVEIISCGELAKRNPSLHAPVIDNILREQEVMNIIAAPKTGKSWLLLYLAISVATGHPWLGFATAKGRVLYIDNELHLPTLKERLDSVTRTASGGSSDVYKNLDIISLRGNLMDIEQMKTIMNRIKRGHYKLIILDAFYRCLPNGVDENSNSDIARLYNTLDRYARQTGSAIALVHHTSKGNQANKAVTDVGSGASSQARAADTHLTLRAHDEKNVVVVDLVTRSWKSVPSFCARWDFPNWSVASDLDSRQLRRTNGEGSRPEEPVPQPDGPTEGDLMRQVRELVPPSTPVKRKNLVPEVGEKLKMSERAAERLVNKALVAKLIEQVPGKGNVILYVRGNIADTTSAPVDTPPETPGGEDVS